MPFAQATDCHVHFYGPFDRYPESGARWFDADEALPSTLAALEDAIGIGRLVVVQPSGYGHDNRRTLDALEEVGRPARAVVSLPFDVSDDEIARLDRRGARGARFSLGTGRDPADDDILALAQRLDVFGWHVEFLLRRHVVPDILAHVRPLLAAMPCPYVIPHFSEIPTHGGVAQDEFRIFLDLQRETPLWVKISGLYRSSARPVPYMDYAPLAQAFLDTAPDRVLWGSDWPQPHFEGDRPSMPQLIESLRLFIADDALLERVLVTNPERLYRFGDG